MIGGSNRFFTGYPPMPYKHGRKDDLYRCVLCQSGDMYKLYTTRERVLHYTDETLPDPIKIALGFIKAIPARNTNPWVQAGDLYMNNHSRKLDGIGWLGKVELVHFEPPNVYQPIKEYYYVIILPRDVLSEISNGL